MASMAPRPLDGVIAELLEIAKGDWELVKQAGRYVDGRLYVSRNLLRRLVEDKENAKGNASPHGKRSP